MAPVALNFRGSVKYTDGTQPPALEEVVSELDKNGAIEAAGLRACGKRQLETHGPRAARRICRESIVGTGIAHVSVESAGHEPPVLPLPLILFNGGVSGRTTTLFIQSSVAVPTPTPIVATVKLKRSRKGRFGLEAVAMLPRIADGNGSVLDFNFTVKRRLESAGAEQHYAIARCPDGHLNANITSVFSDGSRLVGGIVRHCVPAAVPVTGRAAPAVSSAG
jgi:hypothetical protein